MLVKSLAGEGIEIRSLDIGGGLGIRYREEEPPSPEEWARSLLPVAKDLGCRIISEPGRVLVGNAGILVTRVLYVKSTTEKRFAIPSVRSICTRRISLGADGLILVERSDRADFRMRFYNADGGQAEMCGNGARCLARFAFLNRITMERMCFETQAGPVHAEVIDTGARIMLGGVRFSPQEGTVSLDDVISADAYFAVAGVPHVVYIVDELDALDVVDVGRRIRYHRLFEPKGTNANFVRITGPHSLVIRTYERGVEDETLACGTGATASSIVAASLGLVSPPDRGDDEERLPSAHRFRAQRCGLRSGMARGRGAGDLLGYALGG